MATDKKGSGKKPPKNFLGNLLGSTEPESQPLNQPHKEPAPAPPREDYVVFNNRLLTELDVQLSRVVYWLPGNQKKVKLFNDAMRQMLEQYPERLKPTPKELGEH